MRPECDTCHSRAALSVISYASRAGGRTPVQLWYRYDGTTRPPGAASASYCRSTTMKTLITTIALVAGLVASADSAMAKSAAYCAGAAQNAVDGATHPAGSALLGCGAGALLGQVLTNGNGGAVIGGCAAGGATGLILSDAKRQQIYNDAYN